MRHASLFLVLAAALGARGCQASPDAFFPALPPAPTAVAASTEDPERLLTVGKELFVARCASCHNERGDKPLPAGLPLNQRPVTADDIIRNVNTRFRNATDEQRRAVVLYMQSFLRSGADDKELVEKLDRHLQEAAAMGFSGSVLVARGERVLLDRGYGWADSNHTRRAAPDTRYWVASISKQFTAAAILQLEEQGKLSTSDPLARFLPAAPPDKGTITIHQLLTHTSGLGQNYAADGIADLEEAVKAICAQPLLSPPGEQFRYANDNYNLLAIIVQVVSGQRFEDYVRGRLFVGAGMKHSRFWGTLSKKEADETASLLKQITEANARPNWGFRGASGVLSTTGDLFRWQQALFAGRILEAAARDKLLRSYVKLSETEVAYGWFHSRTARGRPVLWTRGSEDFGHNAVLKVYPDEDLVVIVASNAGELGDKTRAASRVLSDELEEIIDSR